jgi:hypothetical protein
MEAVISKIDWWACDTTCADELLQSFSSTVSKIVLANRQCVWVAGCHSSKNTAEDGSSQAV